MKNIIVANYNPDKSNNSTKKYSIERLLLDMRCQIENNLDLGWESDDIVVLTNFEFSYLRINAIQINLQKDCLTGSKMFAMRELFRMNLVDECVWIHDLDCWANVKFDCPTNLKDCGFAEYSRPKFNGGSMFYRPEARDLVEKICYELQTNNRRREEPTLDAILRSDENKHRVSILNSTYNLGCSGYVKRYNNSDKPIKVVHFHPTNRIAWDTHARGRNGQETISISERLRKIMIKYYGKIIESYKY
jgi:hypothetical protein